MIQKLILTNLFLIIANKVNNNEFTYKIDTKVHYHKLICIILIPVLFYQSISN